MIGTSPHDELNEELVAYLDGELSPEAVQRVEHRLASDPEFRERLNSLQRAWSMLDILSSWVKTVLMGVPRSVRRAWSHCCMCPSTVVR